MIDRYSETWVFLEGVLRKEQEKSTAYAVSVNVNERTADMHRGKIDLVKSLLKLAAEKE